MSFTAKQKQPRSPVIRRVVRKGAKHVCGICRSEYEFPIDAEDCLEDCWQAVLELPAVIRHGRRHFRCRFCSRDYESEPQATYCVELCKSRITKNRDIETRANLVAPPRRKKRVFKKIEAVKPPPLPSRPAVEDNPQEEADAATLEANIPAPPGAAEIDATGKGLELKSMITPKKETDDDE